ncbi:MAG: hypothetical protein ABIJ08_02290 [Nanoarchaeota archaeon]
MNRKAYHHIIGIALFMVLTVASYIGFFYLLENSTTTLDNMIGFTYASALPIDCTNESITVLWESTFYENSDNITIYADKNCTVYSAYKLIGDEELFQMIYLKIDDFFFSDMTLFAAIHGNFTEDYINSLDQSRINQTIIDSITEDDLKPGNVSTVQEADNKFLQTFNIPSSVWRYDRSMYVFESNETTATSITSINGIVMANYSYESYVIMKIEVDENLFSPIISTQLSNITVYGSKKINLADYIYDSNDPISNLEFNFYQKDNVLIDIEETNITIVPYPTNWTGDDYVLLKVTDPAGLSSNITIHIESKKEENQNNRPPEIIDVEPDGDSLLVMVGETINFDHLSQDPDNDTLYNYWKLDDKNWTTSATYEFTPNSTESHILKLMISDGRFNESHQWSISVIERNTYPILLQNIPDQSLTINNNLTETFDLDNYFRDPENNNLEFSFEGNENIVIVINKTSNIPLFYPKQNWVGTEIIRFIADDGNLIKKSNNVTITVRGVPVQPICVESWTCSNWAPEECPSSKKQTRICNDIKKCGTTERKPPEEKTCIYNIAEQGLNVGQTRDSSGIIWDPAQTERLSPEPTSAKNIIFIVAVFILTGLLGFLGFEKVRSQKAGEEEKRSKDIENLSLIRLTDYIRRELQQGFSQEQIKSKLLYEGWNNYIIEKALSQLSSIIESAKKESGIEAMLEEKDIKTRISNKMKAFEK